MKQDKLKVFVLEIFLVVITVFVLFNSNIISTFLVGISLTIYMLFVCFCIKFKKCVFDEKNQVTLLMTVFGIIYLSGFYLMGMYFGFNRAVVSFSFKTLYINVLVVLFPLVPVIPIEKTSTYSITNSN